MPPLPAPVLHAVTAAPLLLVTGARAPSPALLAAARALVAARPAAAPVLVGCAAGVDAAVRPHPAATVLRASSFGRGAWAFARRSVALVDRARATPGAVVVALPSGPCPAGLVPTARPSAAFTGHGAGTWGTLALGVGAGLAGYVALPAGQGAPPGWPLVPVASPPGPLAWWAVAPPAQGPLFA